MTPAKHGSSQQIRNADLHGGFRVDDREKQLTPGKASDCRQQEVLVGGKIIQLHGAQRAEVYQLVVKRTYGQVVRRTDAEIVLPPFTNLAFEPQIVEPITQEGVCGELGPVFGDARQRKERVVAVEIRPDQARVAIGEARVQVRARRGPRRASLRL